ncbi:MAG: DUF5702 domain-containing protein [Blautia marasmi]
MAACTFGYRTDFFAAAGRAGKNTSGLDYNDYLQILLFTSSRNNLTFRCMDMIEQNIRLKPGKENFRIDSCMEGLEMETSFLSPSGKRWTAVRSYGYDM